MESSARAGGRLWILAGAVGLVLLIACANLANLLLARASSRRAELAVRTALGASRGRLVRQILTESLVLALAGGACGILLAAWGTQVLLAAMPDALPRLEGVGTDGRVVAFTAAISMLTGIAFGILPAWKASGRGFAPGLAGPRGHGGLATGRLRDAFVVAEMAVAMVLLVCAGLLLHALWRLRSVRPGFSHRERCRRAHRSARVPLRGDPGADALPGARPREIGTPLRASRPR